MAYKGKYSALKHPEKYIGDPSNIIYRSHWERNVMRWCDETDKVVEWASEEIAIPYQHPVHNRRARYYPDFWIKFKDGKKLIVEVKPAKQTIPPPQPKRQTKKYIDEKLTFYTNMEKWQTATKLCNDNDTEFVIWTEDTLKEMGILQWETDKRVLRNESTKRAKPKLKKLNRPRRPRPKRKS